MNKRIGEAMMPEVHERFISTITIIGEVGSAARGTLGQEISDEKAQELVETLPRYMVEADSQAPEVCMDGRSCARLLNGEATTPRYKMAGGNLLTTYVAQRLIGNGFQLATVQKAHPEASVQEEMQTYQDSVFIRGQNARTGAHTCEQEHIKHPSDSGCGAADKLAVNAGTLTTLIENGRSDNDGVASITAAIMRKDVAFDPTVHQEIVNNAVVFQQKLQADEWHGHNLLDIASHPQPYDQQDTLSGQQAVEVLVGEHEEKLFVINQTDRTLDRDAFVSETGDQVFWVDEGAIYALAQQHGVREEEVRHLYQAMMTFQVATGLTLGQPKLRAALIQP